MNLAKIMEEMLKRYYQKLGDFIQPRRVLVLYGPRRAGKTTLLEEYLRRTDRRFLLDSGDNIRTQEVLSSGDFKRIADYVGDYKLIAIDEAQRIPDVGMGLKIIIDQHPDVQLIATGSSSFDLSRSVGEPLTGRKRTLILFPLAQLELASSFTRHELKEQLENFLIFGSYPEAVLAKGRKDKIELLTELVDSYLLKDILALEQVKGADFLLKLVKLLAFQVGQLVSVAELATQLHLDQKTVQRYLQLLESSFVIFKLGGFSRNLRKEITKKAKYYFYDLGVRNGAIGHFNPLEDRTDVGNLWENFVVSERIKQASYHRDYAQRYFWRTYDQQEIDLIETRDGELTALETKWNSQKQIRPPTAWQTAYPDSTFKVLTPDNYLDVLLTESGGRRGGDG